MIQYFSNFDNQSEDGFCTQPIHLNNNLQCNQAKVHIFYIFCEYLHGQSYL